MTYVPADITAVLVPQLKDRVSVLSAGRAALDDHKSAVVHAEHETVDSLKVALIFRYNASVAELFS